MRGGGAMSIYVYITRRRNPLDPGDSVSLEEWQRLAADDPSFRAPTSSDHEKIAMKWTGTPFPGEAIWTGHPDYPAVWFCWSDGNVEGKNPDEVMIAKMMALAAKLDANVISETGEVFNEDGSHKGFVDGEPW